MIRIIKTPFQFDKPSNNNIKKTGKIDFLEFKILARKLGVEMSDDGMTFTVLKVDFGLMELNQGN